METARGADAILLSAMALPAVRYPDGTEISPQIDLRKALGLFAGVRPVRIFPGLNTPFNLPEGRMVDFVLIRESTEGLFHTQARGEVTDTEARETLLITKEVSQKFCAFAFDLARARQAAGRGKGRVTCVDKAKVFRAFVFFRVLFDEEAARHPVGPRRVVDGRVGRGTLCGYRREACRVPAMSRVCARYRRARHGKPDGDDLVRRNDAGPAGAGTRGARAVAGLMTRGCRIACVGAGYFIQFHLDAWRRIKAVELVGITDVVPEAAEGRDLPACSDLAQMIRDVRPDVLDITVPPAGQADTVRTAVGCGVKVVICQKPFCTSLDEAEQIADIADKAGTIMVVHENFRFMPWYRFIKTALDDDVTGSLLQAACW